LTDEEDLGKRGNFEMIKDKNVSKMSQKNPIDWEKDDPKAGHVISESISPPVKTRKMEFNPIDQTVDIKETSENYEDDEYNESSKMDDSNPDEYDGDDLFEKEVASKTNNAQEFFEELEKIKSKETSEAGLKSNNDK
jgi:hypothetical protein